MGVFDYVICEYPLPVEGANDVRFQTKDTPVQHLDNYKICKDGTLWHEAYDIEDQSDPNAEGIDRFLGCMARVNQRWELVHLTGEVSFAGDSSTHLWLEFSAYFVRGYIIRLELIEDRPVPAANQPAQSDEGTE